jgi:hypothetical protein
MNMHMGNGGFPTPMESMTEHGDAGAGIDNASMVSGSRGGNNDASVLKMQIELARIEMERMKMQLQLQQAQNGQQQPAKR